MKQIKIHPSDTVAVELASGHKVALCDIAAGENVIKYGFPIGHATRDIRAGENLDTTAEYNPYKLTSTVTQLALLPVKINGDVVEITPALEVINWQAGGELLLESETNVTFQGMDFNFGVNNVAKHFRLELFVNGAWKEVSLLHYNDTDPVIHTGNELGGMTANKLRITNISGEEQKVFFKNFRFIRR